MLTGADSVRSRSTADWLPGAAEAHPASPAAAQHARTAARETFVARNSGHLPIIAVSEACPVPVVRTLCPTIRGKLRSC